MSTDSGAVTIKDDNWKTEVLDSAVPVLVDFWAEWCGPCKAIAPILDQVVAELAGKLKLAKANVDENERLAAQFGIRSIPTMLLFKGGKVETQVVGAMSKAALLSKIQPYLG